MAEDQIKMELLKDVAVIKEKFIGFDKRLESIEKNQIDFKESLDEFNKIHANVKKVAYAVLAAFIANGGAIGYFLQDKL